MKAIIMAGGMGTRLRPVTGNMPKPLVPLLGKPMMEHIIRLLKRHGFEDICVSLRYRAGDIIAAFGDGSRLGVRLQYRIEHEALGTAGGVKNCMDFCGGDDFLVISGDAACDFDLGRLMAEHRNRGAVATIALYRHSEPLSYGLVVTDRGGLIRGFVEKPQWPQVVTDFVNTGIYALSPAAMDCVPENIPFDFARNLFPILLRKELPMVGIPLEGYWCDVGTPLSYYQCCADALSGRLKIDPDEKFIVSPQSDPDTPTPDGGIECACKSRAELMGTLSELMLDMGADYADGLRLKGKHYVMHISPLAQRSAVRIKVDSEDTEFARELSLSAKNLIEALDL